MEEMEEDKEAAVKKDMLLMEMTTVNKDVSQEEIQATKQSIQAMHFNFPVKGLGHPGAGDGKGQGPREGKIQWGQGSCFKGE